MHPAGTAAICSIAMHTINIPFVLFTKFSLSLLVWNLCMWLRQSSRQRPPSPSQATRSGSMRVDPSPDRGSSRRSPSPYLQSSGGAGAGAGAGAAPEPQQRRTSNSPMRSSFSGPGSGPTSGSGSGRDYSSRGSDGVSNRRFSTPTPQASQHNDYDSTASAGSARTNGSARAQRSSTPTRAQWKF